MKQYADFKQELKSKLSDAELLRVEEEWKAIIEEVSENVDKDPTSEYGIDVGKRCMNWVNRVYGAKYLNLRNAMWEKGFKMGKVEHEDTLTPESFAWLDKAIDAYYRARIYRVLDQAGADETAAVSKSWQALLFDMYGDDQASKDELVQAALKDRRVSDAAKAWLKKQS